MNKKRFFKLLGLCAGLSLAVGAGVAAVGSNAKDVETRATEYNTPVTVTWAGSSALPGTATNIAGDSNVTIKTSSTNSYTSPIRVYANTTVTINAVGKALITAVTYAASSTGNYVNYARDASVSPTATPTVSDKNVTWAYDVSDAVNSFTFKPSSQTRSNGISVTYVTPKSDVPVQTFTVTYDGNGGSGTMTDPQSPYNSGASVTVLENSFTAPSGKEFDKWNTSADGSGTNYDGGDTFSISDNTILYAQWIDEIAVGGSPIIISRSSVTSTTLAYTSWSAWSSGGISGYANITANNDALQFNRGANTQIGSSLFNTTPIDGRITSIKMTTQASKTARNWKVSGGIVATTADSNYSSSGYTQIGNIQSVTTSGTIWNVPSDKNYSYFMLEADGSNASYISSIEISFEALPSEYTIKFVSDGGTSFDDITVNRGESITLPTPEKTDYYFLGWKVLDGTTVSGDFLKGAYTPTSNVTLKAQWAYSALHVTYNANGATSGSVPADNNTYAYNGNVTVLGNTGSLAITHKSFSGWNTKADGSGTNYSAGNSFVITADVTLYAVWTVNPVTGLRNVDNSVPAKTEYSISESFDPTGLVIYATYSGEGEEEINIASDIFWNDLSAGNSVTGTFGGQSITIYGLTIYAPGTVDHPYTVTEARDAATTTAVEAYVKGIIYNVVSFNSNYSSITYWISDDGTGNTSSKDGLQIYSGKGLSGADFSSQDDLKVGWEVIIKGDLKIYQNFTYELDKNSEIISIVKPVTELNIVGVENNEMSISGSDKTLHTISVMIDSDANDQVVTISHQGGTENLFTVSADEITCTNGEGSFTLKGTGATSGSETFRIAAHGNSSVYVDLVVSATSVVYNNVTMSVSGYHLTGSASVVQGSNASVTIVAEHKFVLPTAVSVLDENDQAITETWSYSNGVVAIENLAHDVHISFSPVSADRELIIENPKIDFADGDEFTTGSDIAVYVAYDDGYENPEKISLWDGVDETSGYKVNSEAFNSDKGGTYEIVISYDGLSASYNVTVTPIVKYSFISTDSFDNSLLGRSTSYGDWANKSASDESNAVYAGNSASPSTTNQIQLRATKPSGIVSTASGGSIKKVTVVWASSMSATRTLDVYASSDPFTSAGDLYNTITDGDKVGSITYNNEDNSQTTTELIIDGSYQYVGVRSNSGALYLDSIQFEWVEEIASESDASVVNEFINTYMQPNIARTNKGNGLCDSEGWYSDARDAFNQLSARQKAILLTSSSYALESSDGIEWHYNEVKARLLAWAAANGESLDATTYTLKASMITPISIFGTAESGASTIVVIISMMSVMAIGGSFFLRSRKEQ